MRRLFVFLIVAAWLTACNQSKDTRGIPGPEEVKFKTPDTVQSFEEQAKELTSRGYKTFFHESKGKKVLMQQYYIVMLYKGKKRSQDSTEAAELQRQHLEHLQRMADEGYLSLAGPLGDDGELRGIAIYHTPTKRMADSLAKLDPMVKAGRLSIEVHPWWAVKGGKLK